MVKESSLLLPQPASDPSENVALDIDIDGVNTSGITSVERKELRLWTSIHSSLSWSSMHKSFADSLRAARTLHPKLATVTLKKIRTTLDAKMCALLHVVASIRGAWSARHEAHAARSCDGNDDDGPSSSSTATATNTKDTNVRWMRASSLSPASMCTVLADAVATIRKTDAEAVRVVLDRIRTTLVVGIIALPRRIAHGIFCEFIDHAQHGRPWWHYGTGLVIASYVIFLLISLTWPLPKSAEANVSVCGYLEVIPKWYVFFFDVVVAAGLDSTVWHTVTAVTNESNKLIAAFQMLLGCACSVGLAGFTVYPRCLWDYHQNFVKLWLYATSLAMMLMLLRDFRKPKFTAIPFVMWSGGVCLCVYNYFDNTWQFYVSEMITIFSYICWCSTIQRRLGRPFSIPYVMLVCGVAAYVLMDTFESNLDRCPVYDKQPQKLFLDLVEENELTSVRGDERRV